MGQASAVKVELPDEARQALEYFETEGTAQDRHDLSEEVSHAIFAARWRAASRKAVDSARAAGGIPQGQMTEQEILDLAVKLTKRRSDNK